MARRGDYLYGDNLVAELGDIEKPARSEEGETPGRHGGFMGEGYADPVIYFRERDG